MFRDKLHPRLRRTLGKIEKRSLQKTCCWAVIILCLLGAIAARMYAFKVDSPISPPIHEGITDSAILDVLGTNANALFRGNIASGVYNTDITHQPEHAFHFDSSTSSNTNFDDGFNNLNGMLALAYSEAMLYDPQRMNPTFLSPLHSSFRDIGEDVVGTYLDLTTNGPCIEEWACPTTDFGTDAAEVQGELFPVLVDDDPDPDPPVILVNLSGIISDIKANVDSALGPHCRPGWPLSDGTCFNRLEDMLTDHPDFQNLAQNLRQLQYEIQAYYAWQHLGHALHSTQDFFAHSNYVEIVSGKHGPPCSFSSPLCDTAVPQDQVPVLALPLPTDSVDLAHLQPGTGLQQFGMQFSKAAFTSVLDQRPQIFKDKNSNHLQTGYFDLDDLAAQAVGQACRNGVPRDSNNYQYCHYSNASSTPPTPGLNKDLEPSSGGEPNLANFEYAMRSATRASIVLLASFFDDLPAGQGLVSAQAAADAKPQGTMPGTGGTILHLGGGILKCAFCVKFPREFIISPAPIVAPHRELPLQKGPAVLVHPFFQLPSLVIPTRHAFIQVAPRKVWRAGERAELVIKAFDKQTGEPLSSAQVEIGSIRGVTFKPVTVTISLATEQRCSSFAGERYCLNRLVPETGHVILPAGYPPTDGNFIIPTIVPQLLVSVPNGGLLHGQTSALTVFARDAQTKKAVQNATVLVAGKPIGPANRVITHKPVPVGTFRVKTKPQFQRQAPLLGHPMIVRVPGYSDEVVRYAIAPPR